MKVLIIKDGEELEVNESYGARLIEQGKAVATALVVCRQTSTRTSRRM